MSWKLPGKLLCITLFFTSCHWYNIVVYFTKKMPFRVPKILRRIQWQNKLRMASECISYNLEFQALPHLHLRCSVRASGALNSPPTLSIETPTSILFENPGNNALLSGLLAWMHRSNPSLTCYIFVDDSLVSEASLRTVWYPILLHC